MKMKKVKLLISLNLIICSLFGQSYLPYYELCNKADSLIYFNEIKLALNNLEEAFTKVHYVHAFQYEKASKCAIEIEDYEKGYLYAKKAILNGGKIKFWNKKELLKFRKTEYYQKLQDSISYYDEIHYNSLNIQYKQIIDSLYYIDQNVIRKNRQVKGKYNIDNLILPNDIFDLDTLIFQKLIELIAEHGFPSEQNIGSEGYEKSLIIIHHNFRKERYEKYHPIVKNAVFKGEYLPTDFEGMYEQYNIWYKNKTYFTTWDKDLSESNLKRINFNRLKYGLKDLSSIKIKKRGLNMKRIW